MSIGYGTKDSSIDQVKTGIRQLKELDLWEVSLVTFPMNEAAGITRVKSAEGSIEEAAELIEQAHCALRAGIARQWPTCSRSAG